MSKENIYLYEYDYNGQPVGFEVHAKTEDEANAKRMLMGRAELSGKLYARLEIRHDSWKYGLAFLLGTIVITVINYAQF